jgi:hypothetical protein
VRRFYYNKKKKKKILGVSSPHVSAYRSSPFGGNISLPSESIFSMRRGYHRRQANRIRGGGQYSSFFHIGKIPLFPKAEVFSRVARSRIGDSKIPAVVRFSSSTVFADNDRELSATSDSCRSTKQHYEYFN